MRAAARPLSLFPEVVVEAEDARVVRAQIGRTARGNVSVAARCVFGLPAVVRTESVLESGEPFPTLYWLTCPAAQRAIGGLESGGFMRTLNERLAADQTFAGAYRQAHERYVIDRDGSSSGDAVSAGGMPDRVKCLHALYAHTAAGGQNPAGSVVRQMIEPLDCPGPCVIDGAPAPGHPHLRGGGVP